MTRIAIGAVLVASAIWAQTDQKTSGENQVRDRGQTPTLRERPGPVNPAPITGTLLDAGCRDRSIVNLKRPPENVRNATPPNMGGADRNASNTTLTGDALQHQVPDLFSRQPDRTCAITGSTRAFAVLLANGKLLDLDEGGNTLATEAVLDTPRGRDMLNGRAFGFKPQVTIKGRQLDNRVFVEQLKFE